MPRRESALPEMRFGASGYYLDEAQQPCLSHSIGEVGIPIALEISMIGVSAWLSLGMNFCLLLDSFAFFALSDLLVQPVYLFCFCCSMAFNGFAFACFCCRNWPAGPA